jgi:hypothetical protein
VIEVRQAPDQRAPSFGNLWVGSTASVLFQAGDRFRLDKDGPGQWPIAQLHGIIFRRFTTLLTGLATIRNKDAGHGAGTQVREVPECLASYPLHLAATNIVFIVSAHTA